MAIPSSSLPKGQASNRPPFFNGTNFNYWKTCMIMHIQSIDYEVWKIICDGPKVPTKAIDGLLVSKLESEWTSTNYKDIQSNAKAVNMLYCALDATEFNRICTCTTAKEIWDKLIVTHEGTTQVKESRVSLFVHNYELFKMKPDENIFQMFTQIIRKVFRSLPKSWENKVIAVIEARDLSTLSFGELMGSLLTHEITCKKEKEEEDKNKKKGIAFKSTSKSQEKEEDASEEDEEMAFITKRFKKFVKKKQGVRKFFKKDFNKDFQKGEGFKKSKVTYYECNKPGHYKSECLELKKQFKKDKHKAMIAAWGEDSDDSDSETNICKNKVANLCLMALEDENEVNDDFFTVDELQTAFDELHAEFKKIKYEK
ncbi:uncharacterized protein LOC114284334 [Camellia sinensis]|uniref:uncharacterized protein LOC114284334 n=1 Tax=Camellia sinensis TaxID=4442 RepID=UPI001035A208|nr:uncharacterized protein LOC114284334 [Camellia sinensis]